MSIDLISRFLTLRKVSNRVRGACECNKMAFNQNQKDGDNGVAEFQFYTPENRTKWESFKKAIYDKSSNQILGRTPKNWGKPEVYLLFFDRHNIIPNLFFPM